MRWLFAAAALTYIVWAVRRLYTALRHGYVEEIDDPWGVETSKFTRSASAKTYWAAVAVTGFLLIMAIAVLFLVGADLISPQPLR